MQCTTSPGRTLSMVPRGSADYLGSKIMVPRWLVQALFFVGVSAKACQGEDLPKDASLRIGVKYKPPTCDMQAQPGDSLTMHYTGKLYSSCTQFDSSIGKDPFTFTLGKGEVIKGWDDGLRGMCRGEKRKLTIPSDLAYGDDGSGESIPGGSALVFEVEVRMMRTCAA